MSSEYLKVLEDEIKKTKAENDYHFKLATTNKEKKEDSKMEKSQQNNDKEINVNNIKDIELDLNNNDLDENSITNKKVSKQNKKNNSKSIDLNNNYKKSQSKIHKKKEANINVDISIDDNDNDNDNYIDNEKKIDLKNIKTCQCCNKKFDSNIRIPYLLECNHIFCKNCLINYFSDEEGIKCPIDGLVGKSLNDLKAINVKSKFHKKNVKKNKKSNISYDFNYNNKNAKSFKELNRNRLNNDLNEYKVNTFERIKNNINDNSHFQNSNSTNKYKNSSIISGNKKIPHKNTLKKLLNKNSSFIENNNINISNINGKNNDINEEENSEEEEDVEYIQNFCNIHPEQRITHFVEDTKELICIHCAFNKLKNNPSIQIKEIPEKCKEYLNDLDTIIDNNKKYAQIIQNSLNDIENNKEKEEKKIIEIYEQLLNLLVTNRNNYLLKIEELYQENENNMSKKLENFEQIIDIAEKLKEDFALIFEQAPYEFNHLTQAFNKFIREINDKNSSDLDIIQYNFSHDECNKVMKYLNNFADVKTRTKTFRFDLLKNSKNNIDIEEVNNFNKTNVFQNKNRFNFNHYNSVKNGVNNYYKSSNNKRLNNINNRNLSNDSDIRNSSLLQNSNDNVKFNFKFKDGNRNYNNFNNSMLNNYEDINIGNSNSNSESINIALNKYIASTNLIRDNLYNQTPMINFKRNKFYNNSDISDYKTKKHFNQNEKMKILNKYKYPIKLNKY